MVVHSVSHGAHLSGYVTGLVLWFAWLRRGRVDTPAVAMLGTSACLAVLNREWIKSYFLTKAKATVSITEETTNLPIQGLEAQELVKGEIHKKR